MLAVTHDAVSGAVIVAGAYNGTGCAAVAHAFASSGVPTTGPLAINSSRSSPSNCYPQRHLGQAGAGENGGQRATRLTPAMDKGKGPAKHGGLHPGSAGAHSPSLGHGGGTFVVHSDTEGDTDYDTHDDGPADEAGGATAHDDEGYTDDAASAMSVEDSNDEGDDEGEGEGEGEQDDADAGLLSPALSPAPGIPTGSTPLPPNTGAGGAGTDPDPDPDEGDSEGEGEGDGEGHHQDSSPARMQWLDAAVTVDAPGGEDGGGGEGEAEGDTDAPAGRTDGHTEGGAGNDAEHGAGEDAVREDGGGGEDEVEGETDGHTEGGTGNEAEGDAGEDAGEDAGIDAVREDGAATTIQAGYRVREEKKAADQAATTIQATWKGRQTRKQHQDKEDAVLLLQALWAGHNREGDGDGEADADADADADATPAKLDTETSLVDADGNPYTEAAISAARALQARWRGQRARAELRSKQDAVSQLQALFFAVHARRAEEEGDNDEEEDGDVSDDEGDDEGDEGVEATLGAAAEDNDDDEEGAEATFGAAAEGDATAHPEGEESSYAKARGWISQRKDGASDAKEPPRPTPNTTPATPAGPSPVPPADAEHEREQNTALRDGDGGAATPDAAGANGYSNARDWIKQRHENASVASGKSSADEDAASDGESDVEGGPVGGGGLQHGIGRGGGSIDPAAIGGDSDSEDEDEDDDEYVPVMLGQLGRQETLDKRSEAGGASAAAALPAVPVKLQLPKPTFHAPDVAVVPDLPVLVEETEAEAKSPSPAMQTPTVRVEDSGSSGSEDDESGSDSGGSDSEDDESGSESDSSDDSDFSMDHNSNLLSVDDAMFARRKAKVVEEEEEDNVLEQLEAAVTIQAAYRGHRGRLCAKETRRLQSLAVARVDAEEDAYQAAKLLRFTRQLSATRIQKTWRGWACRVRLTHPLYAGPHPVGSSRRVWRQHYAAKLIQEVWALYHLKQLVENGPNATSMHINGKKVSHKKGRPTWPCGHRRIAYDGAIIPDPCDYERHKEYNEAKRFTNKSDFGCFSQLPEVRKGKNKEDLTPKRKPQMKARMKPMGTSAPRRYLNSYVETHSCKSMDERKALVTNAEDTIEHHPLMHPQAVSDASRAAQKLAVNRVSPLPPVQSLQPPPKRRQTRIPSAKNFTNTRANRLAQQAAHNAQSDEHDRHLHQPPSWDRPPPPKEIKEISWAIRKPKKSGAPKLKVGYGGRGLVRHTEAHTRLKPRPPKNLPALDQKSFY